jgi:hypothetical protein
MELKKRIRQCNRCQHEWVMRIDEEPKKCPGCGSPYWNKKRMRPATVQAIRRRGVA